MKDALRVLVRVAEELATLAREGVPAMRKGERIRREWFEEGI